MGTMQSNRKFFLAISIILLYVVFVTIVNSKIIGSCTTSCQEANVTNGSSTVPTCMCDEQCYRYGDCCFNAPNSALNVTTYPKCTYVSVNDSFFINRTCTNLSFKQRCMKSANYSVQTLRARMKIPVTSSSTGITYGNMFCAECQNVTGYRAWNVMLTCQTYNKTITNVSLTRQKFIVGNGFTNEFDDATKSWNITDVAANTTEKCTITPVLPDSLKTVVRRCYPNMIKKCKWNATAEQTSQCQKYQSIVFNGTGIPYKNHYCARCNDDKSYKCSTADSYESRTSATTSTASPLDVRVSTKRNTYLHVNLNFDIVKTIQSINFTKVRTETIYYRTFNRTYVRNSTLYTPASIRLCRIKKQTNVDGFSSRGNIFAKYCLHFIRFCAFVAALLIGLHLRAYLSPEYVKTCTNMVTASCALALFMANLGTALYEFNGIGGYIWYYGFISSFFWISSMAFDVTLATWSVSRDFSIATKNWSVDESVRFTVYSWLSWLSPVAALTLILIWHADLANWDFAIMNSYDEDITFLSFFVLPLTVATSISLGFFICSIYVAYTERETIDKLSKLGIEYGLHGGIIFATNVMWACMAVADYTQYILFYYAFAFFLIVLAILIYVASPSVDNFSIKSAKKENVR